MQAAMKKGNGIDGLVSDITPGEVEEQQEVHVQGDNPLAEVMEKYQNRTTDDDFDYLTLTEVLTPDQINLFIEATKVYEDNPGYTFITSEFANKLIQNSYNVGHNNFSVTLQDHVLSDMGCYLTGKPDKPLTVIINGNIIDSIRHSQYVSITINGDLIATDSLQDVSNASIAIHGDTIYAHFKDLENVELTFDGEAPSTYQAAAPNVKKCTFKATCKEEVEKLRRQLDGSNEVYLIRQDGTEERKRLSPWRRVIQWYNKR
jgi:hypothetical protein